MSSWADIERNSAHLETLDTGTLEEFLKVAPPGSVNPTFHARFEQTMQRIRDILSERARQHSDAAEERRHIQMIFWMKIGVAVAFLIGVFTLIPMCMSSSRGTSSPAPSSAGPPQ